MVTLVPARVQQRQEAPSEADTSDVTSGQELREWFPRVRRLCGRNARRLPHDAHHSAEGVTPVLGGRFPPRGSGGEGQRRSAKPASESGLTSPSPRGTASREVPAPGGL